MALDITALKKQREMIDDIIRLASDPDAAPLLEKLLVKNGNGSIPTEETDSTFSDEEESESLLDIDQGAEDTFPAAGRGSQIAAIRKAISRMAGTFTVGDIGHELRTAGMEITNIKVGRALQRLTKMHYIRVVHRGEGSDPNQYEKAKTLLD